MPLDPLLTFFTSDHHFGHEDLYGKTASKARRGIKDAAEGDAKMIEAWNAVVPPGGVVVHGGDFTGGRFNKKGIDFIKGITSQLNGTIMLVLGNHDDVAPVSDLLKIGKFVWVGTRRRVTVSDPDGNVQNGEHSYQEIVVDHYPLRVWQKKNLGAWHLYGHMHNNSKPYDLSFDIGVDTHKFRPYSYRDVKNKISQLAKTFDIKQRKEVRA